MLESHLNAIEAVLIAQGKVSSNARHPNLVGSPREWFVRDFLNDHLPATVKIGQGEIINPDSKPRSKGKKWSNQVDIVLYRHDFPKIVYGKDNSAFLEESVIATVEVKSRLSYCKLKRACEASMAHKALQDTQEYDPKYPSRPVGRVIKLDHPSYLFSYVVAFHSRYNIPTIAKWSSKICGQLNASPERLIDMIVVLGKGVVWRIETFPPLANELKTRFPDHDWAFLEQKDKNLLLLFLHMLKHITYESVPLDVIGYAKHVSFNKVAAIKVQEIT